MTVCDAQYAPKSGQEWPNAGPKVCTPACAGNAAIRGARQDRDHCLTRIHGRVPAASRVAGKDRRIEEKKSIQCGVVLSILPSCNPGAHRALATTGSSSLPCGRASTAHAPGCSLALARCIPHSMAGTAELGVRRPALLYSCTHQQKQTPDAGSRHAGLGVGYRHAAAPPGAPGRAERWVR